MAFSIMSNYINIRKGERNLMPKKAFLAFVWIFLMLSALDI